MTSSDNHQLFPFASASCPFTCGHPCFHLPGSRLALELLFPFISPFVYLLTLRFFDLPDTSAMARDDR